MSITGEFRNNRIIFPGADPGFDLRGAWTLSTGGGKPLKVLNVEVNVIFERRKNSVLGMKKS